MKQIKIKDDKSKKEFINLMEINHHNVVKYFDHFYHTIEYIEHIFIITEYCEDGDLEKKICKIKAEEKKFSEKEIFGWILQATSGLEYLHSDIVRMVHRDIKPENMLLSKKNVLKLADLGVAKELSGTIGRTYAGTIGYMSPELERCKDNADREEGITYSFNTDVWSLGCVLYELIYLNKAFPQGFAIAKKIPSLIGCGSFFNFLQKMLVSEHHNRIDSKDLYELMMKSTFDITKDSSKVIEEKNRLEQEAREKEQRERQEREAREAFDLPKIAEENNRSGELEKDSSLSSSSKQSKNIYKDSIIGLILSGRYQVVKKIGSGAFGLVYLVNDIKIDIKKYKGKAMKIMDQLDSATENELMIFSEISHENIVRYFDHFHRSIKGEGNQTFLITEYCENGDLRNKIEETKRQKRNFDQIQILDWIFQATNALKYLHSRKPDPIIHRDIKPANMLLTERNEIKLADLGISKIMEETHTSTFTGTLVYMSPEVSQAFFMDIKYYPNTDIWSLGCVLYELIFLKKAFPEGQRRNPPIPSNVSSSGIFLKILPKMLEKDCLVRITSRQLFTELENLSNSVNKY